MFNWKSLIYNFKNQLKGKYQDDPIEFCKFLPRDKYTSLKPRVPVFLSACGTTRVGKKYIQRINI